MNDSACCIYCNSDCCVCHHEPVFYEEDMYVSIQVDMLALLTEHFTRLMLMINGILLMRIKRRFL